MADSSACILINIGELDGIRFPIFYCATNYISAVFKKFQALIQSMMKSKKKADSLKKEFGYGVSTKVPKSLSRMNCLMTSIIIDKVKITFVLFGVTVNNVNKIG